MTDRQPFVGNIRIDVGQMRELVATGIRRASAFIRFGLDGIEERDGGNFNLTAIVGYQFWPTEISPELREAARREYQAWLLGSCLRELDLFYSLFLDRVWWAIDACERHGTAVPSNYVLGGSFNRKTNVANKHRDVARKLGTADHFDQLNSLSLARNALTHHAGVVRSPDDCNNEVRDRLEIRWLAFDLIAQRADVEVVVDHLPFGMKEHFPGEGEVMMAARLAERQLLVPEGHAIMLTHPQIAELCMFYRILADKVTAGFMDLLRAKGHIEGAQPTPSAPESA